MTEQEKEQELINTCNEVKEIESWAKKQYTFARIFSVATTIVIAVAIILLIFIFWPHK